ARWRSCVASCELLWRWSVPSRPGKSATQIQPTGQAGTSQVIEWMAQAPSGDAHSRAMTKLRFAAQNECSPHRKSRHQFVAESGPPRCEIRGCQKRRDRGCYPAARLRLSKDDCIITMNSDAGNGNVAVLEAALAYLRAGISLIPVRCDGSPARQAPS